MDLKDKVGTERSWRESHHLSTWGSGTGKRVLTRAGATGCKGDAVGDASRLAGRSQLRDEAAGTAAGRTRD